jgi:hypothetical protein
MSLDNQDSAMHIMSGLCASQMMRNSSHLGIMLLALKYKIDKYCLVILDLSVADACAGFRVVELILQKVLTGNWG